MTENLIFEGRSYISSRRAAEKCGYSQDYIGQLIRSKKIEARMIGRSWFVSEESIDNYHKIAQEESLIPQLRKSVPSPMISAVPGFSDIAKKVTAGLVSVAIVGGLAGGYYFADASVLMNTAKALETTGQRINNAIVLTYDDLVNNVKFVAGTYGNSVSDIGENLNTGVSQVVKAVETVPKVLTSNYMKAIVATGDSVAAVAASVNNSQPAEDSSAVSGVKDVAAKFYQSINGFFAGLFNQTENDQVDVVVVNEPKVSVAPTTPVTKSVVATSSKSTTAVLTAPTTQAVNNYYTTSGVTPLEFATELAVLRADLEVKIRNAQRTSELAINNTRSYVDRSAQVVNNSTTIVQTNTLEVPTLADGCVEVVSGMLTSVGANCGTGGSGVTTFNGLVASTQNFATSSNNGGWGFTSAGSVHTLNIPTASATNVLGLLSNTDWTTFNNKQAAGNYITALTGDATASGPGSAALTLATVNSNVGSFGSSTVIPTFTVNAKGLITGVSTTSLGTIPQLSFTNASGTNATISGNLNIGGLTSTFLAVDQNGKVIATTTPAGGGSGTVSSGLTGQIPYYAAGGTTLTGTSTIFLSNGNVGIGTTSPSGRLHIAGDFNVSALNSSTTALVVNTASGFVGINDLAGFGNHTSSELQINGIAGNSAELTLVRGDANTVAGEVLGSLNFATTDGFKISLASIRATAAETITGSAEGSYMDFYTSPLGNAGTQLRMRLDTTGNLGIGTTTPSNRLEVGGSGYFSGALTAGNITATGTLAIKSLSSAVLAVDQNGNVIATTTTGGSGVTTFNGLIASTQNFATSSNNGGWGFTSAGSVHTLNIPTASATNVLGLLSNTDWTTFNNKQAAGNYITALTGDATASGPGSAALTLATVNSNVGSFGSSTDIPVFTVNAKGLITAAGTAAVVAPAGTLTGATLASNVLSSSLTSLGTIAQLSFTNASGTNATISGNLNIGGLTSTFLAVDQNGKVIATTTPAGGGSGTVSSGLTGQIPYYAAGGTTLTGTSTIFLSNGNVGIGTTSPSGRLHIAGDFNVSALNSSTTALVVNTASGFVGINDLAGFGNHTSSELQINGIAGNSAELTLVRGDANTVAGEVLGSLNFATTDGFKISLASIRATAAETITGSAEGSYMDFYTSPLGNAGTQLRMRLDTTGNLGIGTTTPAAKLSITGTSGTGDVVRFASSTNTGTMFVVKSTGNVGIGTDNPQQLLHVYRSTDGPPVRFEDSNGYCEIDPTSTSWVCTSDRNLKKDITNVSTKDTLTRIAKLQAVSFRWKTQDTNDLRYGFIAQDVESIFPELVTTAANGIKSVAYGGLTPFMVEAIKALNLSVEDLKTRVASVEGRISAVESLLGTTVISSSTTSTSTTLSAVSDWFSSVGVVIENSVARFKSIFADNVSTKNLTVGDTSNFAAAGITVLDRATGQPACMYVENGVITSRPGDCGAVTGVGNNNGNNNGGGNNVTVSNSPEISTSTEPVPETDNATTTEPTPEAPIVEEPASEPVNP